MQTATVTEITNKLRREVRKMEQSSHRIIRQRGKWTTTTNYDEEVRLSPNVIRRKRA